MINLAEPLKLASQSLLSNKLRTILTTMGVVIGVAAVITLVSMGEGAKSYVLNQISGWGVGANSITLQPGDGAGTSIPELTLTYGDMIAIREKVKKIQYLMPEIIGRGRLKYGAKEYTPGYTLGVSQDYPLAYKQKAAEGRFFFFGGNKGGQTGGGGVFFSLAEDSGRKRVAVIGKTVARNLFGNFSPIGEKIKINGVGFIVIGILEEKGAMLTYDMDDMVLIPSSLAELTMGTKNIWEMMITTNDEKDVPEVMDEITKLLLARHRRIDFHMHTQAGLIDITNNILNALTGIVSAIAAISLLVGGIGIMNIMLVA